MTEKFIPVPHDGRCPCCGREVTDFDQFPRVRVGPITISPPPGKFLVQLSGPHGEPKSDDEQYDFASVIQEAYNSRPVQEYLEMLKGSEGQVRVPQELVLSPAPIPIDHSFPWEQGILKQTVGLSFRSAPETAEICLSGVFGPVRSLGSARVYNVLWTIAEMGYQGLFLPTSLGQPLAVLTGRPTSSIIPSPT